MNKYAAKLRKLEGALIDRFDPWQASNLLKSSSPGFNWLFGKTYGMPFGYSTLLWGEQKSGKSLLFYDLAGQCHQQYPDSIVIKFDTEYRDDAQLDEDRARMFGIDLDRFIVFQCNKPEGVFDRIHNDVAALCDEGANVKLMGIDSISALMGRREAVQETVSQHQIGDHAVTLQVGLKSILEMQRKNRIHLVLAAHARDEMDALEVKRGNKKKPAAANAVKHHCEFFINVERNKNAKGRQDELENKFEDETKKDMDDKASEQTGHKVIVWMQDSTMGPKNRVAEFTLDYEKGIVNQHEEIFKLGKSWNVIERVNAQVYKIGSEEFRGKPAILNALATRPDLQKVVLAGLLEREKTVGSVVISEEQAEKEFEAPENEAE